MDSFCLRLLNAYYEPDTVLDAESTAGNKVRPLWSSHSNVGDKQNREILYTKLEVLQGKIVQGRETAC